MALVVMRLVCPEVTFVNQDKEITNPVVPTPSLAKSDMDIRMRDKCIITSKPYTE
jgi:hypothetical protein